MSTFQHAELGDRVGDRATFGDGVGDGFFQIDMLAGADGGERDQGVPVIRGGDGNGIDIVAGEQLPEIAVGRAILCTLRFIRLRLGGVRRLAVHVAHRDQAGFRQSGPGACVEAGTLSAHANDGEVETPRQYCGGLQDGGETRRGTLRWRWIGGESSGA
jgi:hypothetical protein